MKNPLNKRLLRDLKSNLGIYAVIFLFMVMLISAVSGFLVADNSVTYAYNEGFTKYNIEDGHFAADNPVEETIIKDIENEGGINIYSLDYVEYDMEEGQTVRIYEDRQEINLECLMKGEMPEAGNEIALDRMFAVNNSIEVGDTIKLAGRNLKVSGLIAVPDYSSLFENNSDMMFDSINFSIAVVSHDTFAELGNANKTYCYGWKYNNAPENESEEKKISDELLITIATKVNLSSYVPRYQNQAINFTGEDMSGDKAMIILFDYIVVFILAFVFAVTISNTISSEATVIGTLRASGYTRGELVRYYMVLPVAVTLIAAVVGNILGYTIFEDYMVDMYYNSYSLCTYETLWNADAFRDTTVIPILIMIVINFCVLSKRLRLSPLRFIRRDLSKRGRKKAFRLNTKIPFIQRFRIRVLFQNIPNYIILFIGIIFATFIIIFGMMFQPLLEDYGDSIVDSMIAEYQYVLRTPIETEEEGAEKYCLTSLNTTDTDYMTDEVSIYGIEKESEYITKNIPEGRVLVSNGVMDKFGLKEGDIFRLKDLYSDIYYEFEIAGQYTYDAALSVFMSRNDFIRIFEMEEDYFTGYFSDVMLTDIDEEMVVTVIDQEDLTKTSRQLIKSMGSFMGIFNVFGVAMSLLLMYLLSKQII
ncbi:MAG: FtsX-like permease family protein, partial [Wujia sp.]